jgi:hypothetical protein
METAYATAHAVMDSETTTPSEKRQAMLSLLTHSLGTLLDRLENAGDKYVITSNHHVFVGHGKGLNGTGFMVKSCRVDDVQEFADADEAERHINPYLIDCHNKPIFNNPVKAYDFYLEIIDTVLLDIKTIQEIEENEVNAKTK